MITFKKYYKSITKFYAENTESTSEDDEKKCRKCGENTKGRKNYCKSCLEKWGFHICSQCKGISYHKGLCDTCDSSSKND